MPALYVLVLIPILFYIVIPLAGAFRVRSIWRRFRETMVNASFFPICGYNDIIARRKEGYYRFFGEIEAIQPEGLLWVKNSEMTMTVKMNHCHVYMIPSEKKKNSQMPTKLPWSRVFSLPEGTAVYISGDVKESDGRVLFSGSRKDPLTVILYDGEMDSLLERSISCGRQKNEYWNFMTPWSIGIGGILSLVLLNMMIQAAVSTDFLIGGIIVAALPVVPFLPPGLFFFLLYTSMWRRGRLCRADRDLVSLPLRFEERNIPVSSYLHQKFDSGDPLLPLLDGYTQRGPKNATLWSCSAFGAVVKREDGKWLGKPEDPMKEYLVIEDDPRKLILRASGKASVYEILSILSMLLSLTSNIFLMVFIINLL